MIITRSTGMPERTDPVAGSVVAFYFGRLVPFTDPVTGSVRSGMPVDRVMIILLFSLIGIAGSYFVAWFGIRINTYANS
ncbi:MAG: hypothetical protein ACKN94_14745, partial [Pirellulaceae bacterium]